MVKRFTLIVIIALTAMFSAHAEARFSIRYHDKNIYYPGDNIQLKITISNPEDADLTFYLADNPIQSFGFYIRSLTGELMPPAEGFTSSLSDVGIYRVIHLSMGQELSINVDLSKWVELSSPGQFRLTGFFYSEMRGPNKNSIQADSVLDLTVMPETDKPWEDELDSEVKNALIQRNLDPQSIVKETMESRKNSHFNRALLYLDLESMARISRLIDNAETLEKSLLEGGWNNIPGFEHPVTSIKVISSQIYDNEATVRINADYNPFGESYSRELRFFLHNLDGYWQIRRIESLSDADVDPSLYGRVDLSPPEVVSELLNAVKRGDWEIAIRYLDISELIQNQPENLNRWKNMSSTEHDRAEENYRMKLVSGQLNAEERPLKDISDFKIVRVSYTEKEATVIVDNQTTHQSANGPIDEVSQYTFRLINTSESENRWQVSRYDIVNTGR
ncbi:MAG: hypothetical protein KAH21_00010 [Spirochaetaceae bacterium]|nr:hypothetical protein [Spirochaetaceae bacterium]